MYTKDQLEQMEIPQLMAIAEQYGVKVSQNDELESVIYNILDAAAESVSTESASTKRKRTRIAKKDTDRVYTVNGKEGENFDVKTQKVKTVESPSLFSDMPASEEPVAAAAEPEAPQPKAFPKHRGRKSKAELAAIAAAQAAEAAKNAEPEEQSAAEEQPVAEERPADDVPVVEEPLDEEPMLPADDNEEPAPEMLEQLQEHMAQHNQQGAMFDAELEDGVWEGDPGDGTDFITVVDLPIEDQAAIPTLDIFDRPVVQQP